MGTMKAVVVEEPGGVENLVYKDYEKPKVKNGYVLVKNHYIGVNYIDIYHRNGVYKLDTPFIIGRESTGEVIEVTEDESDFKIGDRVVYIGEGTYAEFSLAKKSGVQKLPDDITYKTAAAIGLQGLTALTMVRDGYPVKNGDWILVHAAAGGVGQLLCKICAHLGANVIGTVGSSKKAEVATNNGAMFVIESENYDPTVIKEKVNEWTGNLGCHAVLDGVGKATFDTSIACARRLGTVISFGNASGVVPPTPLQALTPKNLKLMRPQLFAYLATPEEAQKWWGELFELLRNKVLGEPEVKTYSLEQAQLAHEDLEQRKTTGKLLLKVCDCK